MQPWSHPPGPALVSSRMATPLSLSSMSTVPDWNWLLLLRAVSLNPASVAPVAKPAIVPMVSRLRRTRLHGPRARRSEGGVVAPPSPARRARFSAVIRLSSLTGPDLAKCDQCGAERHPDGRVHAG